MSDEQTGFGMLPCLRCGEEVAITLDLDDCCTFRCPECNADFTVDEVQTTMNLWAEVLTWLDTAPKLRTP